MNFYLLSSTHHGVDTAKNLHLSMKQLHNNSPCYLHLVTWQRLIWIQKKNCRHDSRFKLSQRYFGLLMANQLSTLVDVKQILLFPGSKNVVVLLQLKLNVKIYQLQSVQRDQAWFTSAILTLTSYTQLLFKLQSLMIKLIITTCQMDVLNTVLNTTQ